MTMQYLETELRKRGDKIAADVVAALSKHIQEVPLTEKDSQRPETPEKKVEIKRFTLEARSALETDGYVICELVGDSIQDHLEKRRPFWSTWFKDSKFATQSSIQSEVAINLKILFLPKSNKKTLTQQERMVKNFSEKLSKKIKGVCAIIGEAADYVGVVFAHFDSTGERLFGEEYNYNYARTKTPTVGSGVVRVGYFYAAHGLHVDDWSSDGGRFRVWAVPLVVPK